MYTLFSTYIRCNTLVYIIFITISLVLNRVYHTENKRVKTKTKYIYIYISIYQLAYFKDDYDK